MGRRKKEAIPEAGKKTKRRVKAKSEAQETAPKRKYERRKKGFNEIPSPEIIPINQAVSNLTSDPEMYFLPMAQDEIYLINPYACGVSSWLPKAKLTRRNCPFFSVELVLEGTLADQVRPPELVPCPPPRKPEEVRIPPDRPPADFSAQARRRSGIVKRPVSDEDDIGVLPRAARDGDLKGVVRAGELLRVCLPEYLLWMSDLTPIANFEPFAQVLENERRTWLSEILVKEFPVVAPDTPAVQVAGEMTRFRSSKCYVREGGRLVGVVRLPKFLNKIFRE